MVGIGGLVDREPIGWWLAIGSKTSHSSPSLTLVVGQRNPQLHPRRPQSSPTCCQRLRAFGCFLKQPFWAGAPFGTLSPRRLYKVAPIR